MRGREERVQSLKRTDLFKDLGDVQLMQVADILKERVYPPNTTIVREGAPGTSMFIMVSGRVEVKKREPSLGLDLTIATLEAGSCFGEMALLTGRPRSATVQSTEMTEVFVLEKADFDRILTDHPSIAISLNRILAERLEAASLQRGLTVVPLSRIRIDTDVLSLLPKQMILAHKVLPIAISSSTLRLGMVNPHDLVAMDEVRKHVRGVAIEPVAILEEDFRRFMERDYGKILSEQEKREGVSLEQLLNVDQIKEDLLKDVEFAEEGQEDEGVTDLAKEAQDAPIVRLANNIIALALKEGASDIHIEPTEKNMRVRFRVDGILREQMVLPKKVQLPLVSRIKIMSRLDITEKRLPQDGRVTMRLADKTIDFRISTVPVKYGEKVVARILDKSSTMLGLDKLITQKETLAIVREMIKRPYGIIYVTGPTGSGKTTTLYSALSELNRPEVNISTVEDPIEYDLPGINQVQVNPDIGLDFARVLRSFLRQDPDIILVGETRDQETAKIAVEAALTGHLVFTTLHANDAASTFTRLYEMGIEPFLVSTSVIGVIAQRLVRRICPRCKEPFMPDDLMVKYLGLKERKELFRGRGCDFCNMTGYKGRVGIYEVLKVTEQVRKLVAEGAEAEAIREEAIRSGMRTLKDYAILLLEEGATTVDEVLRTVVIQT